MNQPNPTFPNQNCISIQPTNAQFGVGGNRRNKGGAASFEELNKLAADRMVTDEKGVAAGGGAGGLEAMLGDLGDMDLGALMKDLDPNTLQDLVAEGMKDPAIQEMVSFGGIFISFIRRFVYTRYMGLGDGKLSLRSTL